RSEPRGRRRAPDDPQWPDTWGDRPDSPHTDLPRTDPARGNARPADPGQWSGPPLRQRPAPPVPDHPWAEPRSDAWSEPRSDSWTDSRSDPRPDPRSDLRGDPRSDSWTEPRSD